MTGGTKMRVLRAVDRKPVPWKNGGGTTTEVAAFPEGASLDAFDWRVSIADVASEGLFSHFPGVDRTLLVLSGRGIRLDIAGRDPVELGLGSEPHAFPADVATSARLIDGPIRDLNVMTRRGRFEHGIVRLPLDAPGLSLLAPVSIVLSLDAPVRVHSRHGVLDLAPLDALISSRRPAAAGAHDEAAHDKLAFQYSGDDTCFLIFIAIWPAGTSADGRM